MFYLETKNKKTKFTSIYIYIYSILIIIPCFITGLVTNLIFTLIKELSDSSKENYIPKMMKRYEFISKVTDYYVKK